MMADERARLARDRLSDFAWSFRERGLRHRDRRRRFLLSVQAPLLLLTVAIGFVVFGLLGQTHEAILSLAEQTLAKHAAGWPIIAAAVMLTLLSVCFAFAFDYYSEPSTQDVIDFEERASAGYDGWRCAAWILIAASPWLWVIAGAWGGVRLVEHAAASTEPLVSALELGYGRHSQDALGALKESLYFLMGLSTLSGVACCVALWMLRRSDGRAATLTRRVLLGVLLAAYLAIVILPIVRADSGFELISRSGTLGAGGMALFAIVATLAGLGWVARQFSAPYWLILLVFAVLVFIGQMHLLRELEFNTGALMLIAAAVFVGSAVYGLGVTFPANAIATALILVGIVYLGVIGTDANDVWSPRPEPIRISMRPAVANNSVESTFNEWLGARANASDERFPVFVVAARGGGAYAAAASAALMTRLECASPGFSRHVFAISGVSGGSIGAVVYRDLLRARLAQGADAATVCDAAARFAMPEFESRALDVVTANHIGVALGALPADVLQKILPRSWVNRVEAGSFPLSRFRALTRSFADAQTLASGQEKRDAAATLTQTGDGRGDAALPRLVLNTTWSETGYRVAFADFDLGAVRIDGRSSDLRRFQEFAPALRAEEECHASPRIRGALFRDYAESGGGGILLSEIKQAMASATFPIILPSYARCAADGRIWNFVDGGYYDSSAATTALDLFERLNDLAANEYADCDSDASKPCFDLHLVLLSDGRPEFGDFSGVASGNLRDTGAIVSTVLNLRERQSNVATARAEARIGFLASEAPAGRRLGVTPITIDTNRAFRLALGWSLSRTTAEAIALQIGHPDWIARLAPLTRGDAPAARAAKVALQNSCGLWRIIAERRGGRPGSPPPGCPQ